jgi:hypothetical protein
MVTQPRLHDNDLVLWTQLLGEVLNAQMLERLRAEHPDVRYSHGFLIQQLVEPDVDDRLYATMNTTLFRGIVASALDLDLEALAEADGDSASQRR